MSDAIVIGGRYRVCRLLAQTATTRVLLAVEERREVVVKLAARRTAFELPSSAFFGQRSMLFGPSLSGTLVEYEGSALARLDDARVVKLIARGIDGGLPFLVLEYVAGERLDRWHQHRQCGAAAVVAIARELLGALAHLHGRGVVHRDLKPGNVLIRWHDGRPSVKLLDFELATVDGIGVPGLVGSAAWRAPEQTASAASSRVPCDHRADLYALGAVLYALLAGGPPFGDAVTCTLDHATCEPRDLGDQRRDTPAYLIRLVHRLLAKHPGERPASAADALAELADDAATEPWLFGMGSAFPSPSSAAVPARLVGAGVILGQVAAAELARSGGGPGSDFAAELVEWVARREQVPRASSEAHGWLRLARSGREIGRLALARDAAQIARGLAPDDPDAAVELAEINALLRAWPQALRCCDDALRVDPLHRAALAQRGLALLAVGDAGALPALAAALESSSLEVRWLFRVARESADAGLAGLAVAAALRAQDQHPQRTAGLLGETVGRLVQALAQRPDDPDLLLPLAVACVQLGLRARLGGNSPEASRHFAQALECGRPGLRLTSDAPDPSFLLHVAIAEWDAGDERIGDDLRDGAIALGLLTPAWLYTHLGTVAPVPRQLGRELSAALALLAAKQERLASRFAEQSDTLQPIELDVLRLFLRQPEAVLAGGARERGPEDVTPWLVELTAHLYAGRITDGRARLAAWNTAGGRGTEAWSAWLQEIAGAGAAAEAVVGGELLGRAHIVHRELPSDA